MALRLYNTPEWRAIRREVLARDPVCRFCKKEKSTTVDHIERHRGDPAKFFRGPFQGLCKRCHDSIKQIWEKSKRPPIGPDGWPINA